MTAGFYSPLPPARTGVADYAARLLGALRRYGNVEVSAQRWLRKRYPLAIEVTTREADAADEAAAAAWCGPTCQVAQVPRLSRAV